MKAKVVFFITTFTLTLGAFSQNNSVIDSLENILRTAEEDTNKVDCLNLLSHQYSKLRDHKVSMHYAETALELAETMDYGKGISDSYNNMAGIYEFQDNYPEALRVLYAYLKAMEEIGNKRVIASVYNRIARMYEYQGNFQEALKNQFASLKIKEDIGYTKGIAHSYNNIGNVYQKQGNYPEALKSFLTSLKIKESLEDKKGTAGSYNNIGNIYRFQGNYSLALENYFASLKIKKEIGKKGGIAGTYINIGNVYLDQGDYLEALEYFSASLEIFEEIGYKKYIAYCYNNIGIVHMVMDNPQDALKNYFAALEIYEEIGDKEGIGNAYLSIGETYKNQGNYKDARKYFNNGLSISKEIGSKDQIKKNYNFLSLIDSVEGNFAQSLEHYKLYTLYKDSLINEESKNQIALMKIQYETEKKDKEIDFLNKDNDLHKQQLEKQLLIRNGMIAGTVFLIIVGLLVFRSIQLRRKLEKQKTIAQERNRISADLHDDFGSSLSEIYLLSNIVMREAKTTQAKNAAIKIADNSKHLLEDLSEIIWALNSNNDYLESMVAYIRRYAAEYFENSPVLLQINTPDKLPRTQISAEHRRNMFYAVKEALHNIIKHAQATEAEMQIKLKKEVLSVIIKDNGRGMPKGELNRFGNGMINMQSRMASIKGEFSVQNHKGTEVTLKMPVG